jgi:hypothetical protein
MYRLSIISGGESLRTRVPKISSKNELTKDFYLNDTGEQYDAGIGAIWKLFIISGILDPSAYEFFPRLKMSWLVTYGLRTCS